MSTTPSISPANISPGKLWTFRVLAVAVSTLIGIYAVESLLRSRQGRIEGSDAVDPGMMQYDAELGWKLTSGWNGKHKHHDYAASYSINALGFRNDAPMVIRAKGNRLVMVVGDSFTFGLGVNDDATFVHHLNAARPDGITYSNGSIPGFSTDQQALLIEKRILALNPNRIVLVVYVGNDLFDNQLAFPLQVSSAKPYFELTEGGLTLKNTPVPMERKPRAAGAGGLMTAVWGSNPALWPWRTRVEQQSELFRIFSQSVLPQPDHRVALASRFAPAQQLFDAVLDRIAAACARKNVGLTVVTLAGRSFVEAPDSVSAQYQDVFCRHIFTAGAERQLKVIDLAGIMRARYLRESEEWFYPNEGHLNAAGHRVVAEILQAELAKQPD